MNFQMKSAANLSAIALRTIASQIMMQKKWIPQIIKNRS